MSKITIGPFFTIASQKEASCHSVANLGIQMEWANSAGAMQVQLLHPLLSQGRLRLEHLLFAQRKLDFEVPYAEHQIVKTESGLLLPLEGLLVGLYKTHQVCRGIRQVLEELASVAPFESKVSRPLLKPGYLVANVEAQGFILNTIIREAGQVYAEIVWRPNSGSCRFHTCICSFGLKQDASLNGGTWLPAGTVTVGTLLTRELHCLVPGSPRDLFSREGIALLQNNLGVTKSPPGPK